MVIFLAGALAFVAARGAALFSYRVRPLVSLPLLNPLEGTAWQEVAQQLGSTSSFPGDITAIWFALAGGVCLFNRRVGLATAVVGLLFSFLRIGLGFFYPTDIIAGACLGLIMLMTVLWLRRHLMWFINPTLLVFVRFPGVAYPLALLLLLDVTQQMAWLIGLLVVILGI
jgi:undecaprenyl-diphosphatase